MRASKTWNKNEKIRKALVALSVEDISGEKGCNKVLAAVDRVFHFDSERDKMSVFSTAVLGGARQRTEGWG